MRILQINSVCDLGSTGRTTRELADMLLKHGHESYVAYGHGKTTYQHAFKIGGKLENKFHNLFYTRILGLHGYGTKSGTKRLLKWIDRLKPDLIHLRNLHSNYLNIPLLFNYIIDNKIPVVFTLHDCFNFTGKCSHYTANKCYKWQSQCSSCPLFRYTVAPSFFFDNSQRLFNEKKLFYSKMQKMTIVAVSRWLMQEAEKSILAGNGHKLTHIYNWIDKDKFSIVSTDKIVLFLKKYQLDTNLRYLISVSQLWDKDASRFIDAVRLSKKLPDAYRLILIGRKSRGTVIPDNIYHIPYISSTDELSAAYKMCEAYVHFSVEDTFGKVIAEAMACGAVPIVFASTACGEIPGKYGIVVPPHDIDAIIKALPLLPAMHKLREEIVRYVHENYDYEINAQKYIELYREILSD